MMQRTTVLPLLLLFLFTVVVSISADGFGDRLLRTYFLFQKQPMNMSDAINAGWYNLSSSCDPTFGYQFAASASGATRYNPTFLFYTASGQLAGFGIRVWAHVSPQLVSAGLFMPVSSGVYDIYITTRSQKMICSSTMDEDVPIGDRLNINGQFSIPLTMADAESSGWVMGNCIYEMGIHHAYDLSAPGNMSWNPSTLVPVMPMYDAVTHNINAVLFNVWNYQYTEPLGVYEGPFTSGLFCDNWCANSGCNWRGIDIWTTLHWHFVDPSSISCSGAPCVLSF